MDVAELECLSSDLCPGETRARADPKGESYDRETYHCSSHLERAASSTYRSYWQCSALIDASVANSSLTVTLLRAVRPATLRPYMADT